MNTGNPFLCKDSLTLLVDKFDTELFSVFTVSSLFLFSGFNIFLRNTISLEVNIENGFITTGIYIGILTMSPK